MSRSIQQLPNNSGTTSVTEVYTSTGFSAGDPVYFSNGDYKNPANLTPPSSVNFNFSNPAPYNPYGEGGSLYPAFSYAQMQTGISGGSVRRFAAILTNGNIVQVWINHLYASANAACPYFRVISPSGTVVVSPTLISATFTANYAPISVAALTGGGFAVGWLNNAGGTANSVNYAIYSNTGTVVTSPTQDTSFATGNNSRPIEMTHLANGGFAIAVKNSSAVIFIRAYSSTGVGAYSTINTGTTTNSNTHSFGLVSRSDSSVCYVDYTSATALSYAIYSSSGTTIVAPTAFSVTSTTLYSGADASVLSDGTTIVFAYYNTISSNVAPALRFLPASNVLGSEVVAIPNANLYAKFSYAGYYIGVLGITGSNVMLFFGDGFGYMQYAFYNSSGVCISGSNSTGAIPLQIPGGFANEGTEITLLESNGSVFAYWNYATNSQYPVQQICAKISTSTYLVIPVLSTTSTPYVIPSQPTGALILSTVNPSSASYYSTASSSAVSTNTPTTVTGSTALESFAVDAIASCALPNGGFVIAYRAASGFAVTAKVFSPAGGLLSTIAVGTGIIGNPFSVRVVPLSGGGFVVGFALSAAVITLNSYSSAGALTATTTVAINNSFGATYNFDMCGLLNNNFAIVFSTDGTNAAVRVYTSALVNIYSLGFGGTPQGFAIAGNSWGGFAISYFSSSSGNGGFRSFVPTGTNTWAQTTFSNWSMSGFVVNPQMVATQSGVYVITAYGTSAYPGYAVMNDSGPSSVSYTGSIGSWPWGSSNNVNSNPMMGIGLTGNGNVVYATAYSGTSLGIGNMSAQVTWSQGQQLPYQQGVSYNLGNGFFSPSAYNISNIVNSIDSQPRITPLVGNNCLITFRSTPANAPAYIIVNGNSYSSIYNVTAGVTPSAPVPVAPITASGVTTGVFAGVAITSATAGSTGQLANNGQVLLGASYTSTATGAFDSTGNAVSGVKGTFNGRSVNLQGNS